jgi:hypothetical protein
MAERKLALRQKPKQAMKALQYGGKLSVLHKPRCVNEWGLVTPHAFVARQRHVGSGCVLRVEG